jgi:putative membrane protein
MNLTWNRFLNAMMKLLMMSAALMFCAWFIPGIYVSNFVAAIIACLILGILNLVIRPVLIAISFPLNLFTFGLFTFIINAAMLMLTGYITPGFDVHGLIPALEGSIILSIVSFFTNYS